MSRLDFLDKFYFSYGGKHRFFNILLFRHKLFSIEFFCNRLIVCLFGNKINDYLITNLIECSMTMRTLYMFSSHKKFTFFHRCLTFNKKYML